MTDVLRPAPAVVDLVARSVIELVGLRLEPSTLSLQGGLSRVTVEPRVMQVLVALVDAAGAVASRESLLASCWAGLVVGDDALHRAVAGARRALRDAGASELVIETIPRVGYRLVSTAAPPYQGAPEAAREDESLPEAPAVPATRPGRGCRGSAGPRRSRGVAASTGRSGAGGGVRMAGQGPARAAAGPARQ